MGGQGSRTRIAVKKEASFGVQETGAFIGLNFVSDSLKTEIKNKESKTVRPDRQVANIFQSDSSTDGTINTEFQATNLDALLPSFLWDTDYINAGTAASTTNFTTETGAGVGGIIGFNAAATINLVPGNYFYITGASNQANNGLHRVKAVNGKNIQVYSPLVTQAAQTVVLKGDNTRNGVTRSSWTIEKAFLDIPSYFAFIGMVPDSLELSVESEEAISCDLSFVGTDEKPVQDAAFSSSVSALSTLAPFISSSALTSILVDNVALAACQVQKISVEIKNKAEGRKGVGFLGSSDIVGRTISVAGKISMYFNSKTEYLKYKNSTGFSLSIVASNASGNVYVFNFDKCKYDKATANIKGKNDDIFFDASFMSMVGDNGYTVQITKIA